MEGARQRGRPKKTWRQIVEKDCQACKLNREDAMDLNRWRNQKRVNVSSGTGSPGVVLDKIQRAVKQLCVCV